MAAIKVGKQIRVVSYFAPEAAEKLRLLSATTRVTQAVYLREAIDDLLRKYAATIRKETEWKRALQMKRKRALQI